MCSFYYQVASLNCSLFYISVDGYIRLFPVLFLFLSEEAYGVRDVAAPVGISSG